MARLSWETQQEVRRRAHKVSMSQTFDGLSTFLRLKLQTLDAASAILPAYKDPVHGIVMISTQLLRGLNWSRDSLL